MTMPEYKVEVTTGNLKWAGTFNSVYLTIRGSEGQSERKELNSWGVHLHTGQTSKYSIHTQVCLGEILLLKLEKENGLLIDDDWYCSNIVVTSPKGEVILFPCYKWLCGRETVKLRGGRATKVFEDHNPLLIDHRRKEKSDKKRFYQWTKMAEGLPYISQFRSLKELPLELSFTENRESAMVKIDIISIMELFLMLESTKQLENLEEMKKEFTYKATKLSEKVAEIWKEDDFFGYQFLNGVNPTMIKRCTELPKNFPVTEEMVKNSLKKGSSLKKEMQEGRIFIYDQKKMDGILGREYNGKRLQITPGLCLFYLNPEKKMMPIAIQLQQEPSEENPIFLPSDSETDWLLAKMFIKNVDILDHESVHHLMNTHFLAEVFAVATLRCLPEIHPLYKLLIPHFRFTLPVNVQGRPILLGEHGGLQISSIGSNGAIELMRRSLPEVTYSSLCLPENITARGLDSVPNFYYKEDGLKLWEIINRFVKAMVSYYYETNCDVEKDSELQDWISEIFTYGFLKNEASGIPSSFHTAEEVTKFITVVIFTVSAQHGAINNGQVDYITFTPNAPLLLHKPPPTTKGQTSPETILQTLPNHREIATFNIILSVLAEKYSDRVCLGTYPDQRFDEVTPEKVITMFRAELDCLVKDIEKRNQSLAIPYTYLNPSNLENSITE